MNADYFRMLYQYNYTAHDRVWDCAMQLTDEQFTRHLNYSIGSIRNQLCHVMSVDARWFARIQGLLPLPDYSRGEDFPTRQAVRAKWDEVRADVLGYVNGLTDDELQRTVHYDVPRRGGMKQSKVYEILGHVVNHGTDHRAQILAMLHLLDAPTVEQDLMIYLWDIQVG